MYITADDVGWLVRLNGASLMVGGPATFMFVLYRAYWFAVPFVVVLILLFSSQVATRRWVSAKERVPEICSQCGNDLRRQMGAGKGMKRCRQCGTTTSAAK